MDARGIAGVAERAEANAQAGARAVTRHHLGKYHDWVMEMAQKNVGALHRHVKAKPRCENELLTETGPTWDPAGTMETKRDHYSGKWEEGGDNEDELLQALSWART